MGIFKGSSNPEDKYDKLSTVSPEVKTYLQQALQRAGLNEEQAAKAYQEFTGSMNGANPITEAANKNFQQQTVPGILNAYGTGNKGSSSLNQALASGASTLNTNLAAAMAELKLKAAQGLSNIGANQGNVGSQTNTFAYQEKDQPIWKRMLQGGVSGAATGSQFGPWGAVGGGRAGAGIGAIR